MMSELPEIHKFGGSCLRDSSDIAHIAHIVNQSEHPTILVVSALWGTTDRLMRAAKEPRYAGRLVNDLASHHLRFAPTLVESNLYSLFQRVLEGIETSLTELAMDQGDVRAYNQLLASGERLSALVIAHELTQQGINAHPVGAEDIGLCLNGKGTARTVDMERSSDRLDRSAFYGVPVVTGWFGEGTDGNIALLGRGGSDHTATALAALLGAHRVVLWKDVHGIYPINPRWGVQSAPIPYLGYSEAIEFANADATILHQATVDPVYALGIPIEIRHLASYQSNGMRTVIGPDIENASVIKGIACIPRVACIEVELNYIRNPAGELGELLQRFTEADIRICSFETTNARWKFVVPQHEVKRIVELIKPTVQEIQYAYHAALLSFIGCRNLNDLKDALGSVCEFDEDLVHLTSSSTHMLTDRVDISKMLDEMMATLNPQ